MDFRLKTILVPKTYLWIDVLLIDETDKAILIAFDGKEAWFPKAWIRKIKRNRCEPRRGEASGLAARRAISIKILEYHWAAKFG